MAQVNERNNSDKPPEVQHLTFRQFIEGRWKAYSVTAKHQPSTVDCYNSLLKCHLLPRFGEMLLKDIKPLHISEFLEAVHAKSPKRVRFSHIPSHGWQPDVRPLARPEAGTGRARSFRHRHHVRHLRASRRRARHRGHRGAGRADFRRLIAELFPICAPREQDGELNRDKKRVPAEEF